MEAKTAADAAARLPERLRRDPAAFLAELPALVTTVAGLAVAVDGARCHLAHPRVQAAVLVALKKLIHGGGDWVRANGQTVHSNIGKLFELGALEAALAAMSAHAAERAVQAAASGMLSDLVIPSPHATAICAKFAELGGIARVMGTLDAFPRDRELVMDAVDLLGCLMIGDTARKAQIIALGGMERVLVAMDNHPDGGIGVCFQAVFALDSMSQAGPEAQQRLAALGAAARVRAAMAVPDVDERTTEYGQKLLARLPAVGLAQQEGAAAGSAGAASISCGADVEIHSLEQEPELNGVRGKVVEPQDPVSGRWGVKIVTSDFPTLDVCKNEANEKAKKHKGRVLALKPANLVLWEFIPCDHCDVMFDEGTTDPNKCALDTCRDWYFGCCNCGIIDEEEYKQYGCDHCKRRLKELPLVQAVRLDRQAEKLREEEAQLKLEKKKIEDLKRELEKKKREASKGLQVPPYWKNKSGFNLVATTFVRDVLQKFMVESACCSATKKTRVESVERVENESLWQKYQLCRETLKKTCAAQHVRSLTTTTNWQPAILSKLSKKYAESSKAELSTDINEFYLFHGTSSKSARFICEHGFDERVANLNGLYGAGSYFAINSCKAHQYSLKYKDSSTLVMIVCRVVMGSPYCTSTTHTQKRRPPDNAATPGRPFDSIFAQHGIAHGGHQQHNEYVVFDRQQVYPEFIVRYTV